MRGLFGANYSVARGSCILVVVLQGSREQLLDDTLCLRELMNI